MRLYNTNSDVYFQDDRLATYLKKTSSFPILVKNEEIKLARQWLDNNDKKAAHHLITSHLRLVIKIALGFKGYGLPVADLISEGNIGLMKAVKKFNPDLGFRLSTYAMWWIKASITEYVLRSWSLVKIGTVVSQKKLFFNLRKIKIELGLGDNKTLTVDQAQNIAEITGTYQRDVMQMNQRMTSRDFSLNTPISDRDDNTSFQDNLADPSLNPEDQLSNREEFLFRKKLVNQALKVLTVRERDIFIKRHLNEVTTTLSELGTIYKVSKERIRQIDNRAFKKVDTFVKKMIRDYSNQTTTVE